MINRRRFLGNGMFSITMIAANALGASSLARDRERVSALHDTIYMPAAWGRVQESLRGLFDAMDAVRPDAVTIIR